MQVTIQLYLVYYPSRMFATNPDMFQPINIIIMECMLLKEISTIHMCKTLKYLRPP
jgi:hypothetical protein